MCWTSSEISTQPGWLSTNNQEWNLSLTSNSPDYGMEKEEMLSWPFPMPAGREMCRNFSFRNPRTCNPLGKWEGNPDRGRGRGPAAEASKGEWPALKWCLPPARSPPHPPHQDPDYINTESWALFLGLSYRGTCWNTEELRNELGRDEAGI